MSHTLPLMGKNHPLTGEPIRAIGWRPDGSPLWPIMGGDPSNDTPPERPEDVAQDEWDALGDKGKQAIVRVRQERDEARTAKAEADRALAAAKARPAPPTPSKPAPGTDTAKPAGGQPDISAIVQEAVSAAIKPFQQREEERDALSAAEKVRDAVLAAAKDKFHDVTDALQVDLAALVDDNGAADPAKVTKAVDELLATKPHLAKSTVRVAPVGIGGAPSPASPKERVQAILADMQRSTGVRLPSS